MFKKYYLGGLLAVGACAVVAFVFVMPAQAVDLRFTDFFDKFAPIEQVKAQESNETISPLVPSQPLPPPPVTCRVNGVDMPGDCSQYPPPSDSGASGGNVTPQPMQEQQNNQQPMQPGPNDEQMAKQQVQRLKDMKRGLKPLQNSIMAFEKLMTKGNSLSDALKEKITQAKDLSAKINNAQTADEISNEEMDTLRELMNGLEEERQSMQRLKEFRSNITNTERGVKNFESQLTRLQKQKITIPTDITENLSKIKQLIAVVKTAQSWEEMQTAGVEDMGDLMGTLNDSRNQLEMLGRWPQTLKQINSTVKDLDRQVKKAKTIVDKLLKKGIDLNENYNKFAEGVVALKAVVEDAKNKMTSGQYQEAFDALEDGFYGNMDDVRESQRVIEIMSNLGRFTSDFKSGITQAQKTIKALDKKKIDTTDLKSILEETKVKGAEVTSLLKVKPVDKEVILSGLEELENLRIDFGDKVGELTNDETGDMPWEQGTQQFKTVQMAPNFDQYFPQQQQQQMQPMQPIISIE